MYNDVVSFSFYLKAPSHMENVSKNVCFSTRERPSTIEMKASGLVIIPVKTLFRTSSCYGKAPSCSCKASPNFQA